MGYSYEVVDYQSFGAQLLDTYDLDPLYVILANSDWPESTMKRFMLAYWIFYSAGVACRCAERSGNSFYKALYAEDMAHAPRGHERRHMRGQAFIDTVSGLHNYGSPEKVVDAMTNGNDFQSISAAAQSFRGFGPWIAWKIADMTERVLQRSVDFSNAEIGVYRDPVKGAALIRFGDQHHPITRDELHETFAVLQSDFDNYVAPPYADRKVNIQELETIACKYKSHVNGHYPPGNDTLEIMHGLHGCGDLASCLEYWLTPYYELWRNND